MNNAHAQLYTAFNAGIGGGNEATVVRTENALTDAQMAKLSGQSSTDITAFITTMRPREYAVHYYSEHDEIAFCGHASLACAAAIGEVHGPGPLSFDTRVGAVEMAVEALPDGRWQATLNSVATRTRPITPEESTDLLPALRLGPEVLDPAYPLHVAYGGNDHPLVALRSRQSLAELEVDLPRLELVMAARGWTTAHLFHATSPTEFTVRNLFPEGEFHEDPASGSAAIAFGGYLRDLSLLPMPSTITLHQGEDMGHPSELIVHLAAGSRSVRVSGTVTRIDR